MHGERKKTKVSRAKGRGSLENTSEFYALRAMHFASRLRRVRRQELWCYAPTCVTVLTALTMHLSNVENISSRSLRVSQRNFLA